MGENLAYAVFLPSRFGQFDKNAGKARRQLLGESSNNHNQSMLPFPDSDLVARIAIHDEVVDVGRILGKISRTFRNSPQIRVEVVSVLDNMEYVFAHNGTEYVLVSSRNINLS